MSVVRSLALICFCFGLFVQGAAGAAAMPQTGSMQMVDCEQMTQQKMSGTMAKISSSSDEEKPCKSIQLSCLLAMNCLPPLLLSEPLGSGERLPATGSLYAQSVANALLGHLTHPEPPPPDSPLFI